MSIWFQQTYCPLLILQHRDANTLSALLGIEFTEIGDDYLCATMPVDNRTRQPYGILHGGASAALAETVGSVASSLVIDTRRLQLCGAGNQCQPHPQCEGWLCNCYLQTHSSWQANPCVGYPNYGEKTGKAGVRQPAYGNGVAQ